MSLNLESGPPVNGTYTVTPGTSQCYARLAAEIFNAKAINKSPDAVWKTLFKIVEESQLDLRYATSTVFDFFMVAEPQDTTFFMDLLRWLKNEYQSSKGPSSRTLPAPKSADDAEDAPISPVLLEMSVRICQTYKDLCNKKATDADADNVCKKAATLIQGRLMDFSDELPGLRWSTNFDNFCEIHEDYTRERIRAIDNMVVPASNEFPRISYDSNLVCSDEKGDMPCPMIIRILAALLKMDSPQAAVQYICKHRDILFYYEPALTTPFQEYVSRELDRTSTVNKFRTLLLAASLLVPCVPVPRKLFLKACALCEAEIMTHPYLVRITLARYVFPILSFYDGDYELSSAVWKVLKCFDIHDRRNLYNVCWLRSYRKERDLQFIEAKKNKHVQGILKQLDGSTAVSVGESLSLLATTNPLVVWTQVCNYMMKSEEDTRKLVESILTHTDAFGRDTLASTFFDLFICKVSVYLSPVSEKCDSASFSRFRTLAKSIFASYQFLLDDHLGLYLRLLRDTLATQRRSVTLLSDLLESVSLVKPRTQLFEDQVWAFSGSRLLKLELSCPDVKWEQMELLYDQLRSGLGKQLVMVLATGGVFTYAFDGTERSLSFINDHVGVTLQYLIDILCLGGPKALSVLPDITTFASQEISVVRKMEIVRPSLRRQIDGRSLDVVEDVKSLIPIPEGINDNLFALFWSLEGYDIFVPHFHYNREIARLSRSQGDKECVSAANSDRLDALKESRDTHVAHVSWLLSELPLFSVSEDEIENVLWEMVLPRAFHSPDDARYTFYFLARSLTDPMPVLDTLFDPVSLSKMLSTASSIDMCGFEQLVGDILSEMSSWPSPCAVGSPSHGDNVETIFEFCDEDKSVKHIEALCDDKHREKSFENQRGVDGKYALEYDPKTLNALDDFDIQSIETMSTQDDADTQRDRRDIESDTDTPKTSSNSHLVFSESEVCPVYTLFREGAEPKVKERWEANVIFAMREALHSGDRKTVSRAQYAVKALSKFLPRSHSLIQPLLEMQGPSQGAGLVDGVMENLGLKS